ncbi:DNA repair protein RadC [Anaerospora sp.]|jgi:DNA repair protein RadC|uniref:RadC family protein n=1 Tax=Anaerospora sp. TaxID=1960278 RepID=UPI0028980E19|nr:DNA repair protein RadC [Anaerospora sp.]MDF2928238.1 repair protein RadC [Anaerospora sp.]
MTSVKPLMMKELPEDERPREKLLAKGPQALSNSELLAILIRTGTANESVMRLAERVLEQFENGGLTALGRLTPREISRVKGIGAAKAVTITAAVELGKRMAMLGAGDKVIIRSPQDAAWLMMPRLRYEPKELFVAIMLSTKNHVLSTPVISVGCLNASIVHPRELFREAINYSAASVILVHNHPSGDPAPSAEDISLTKKLVEAGHLLDISVLDHVIIGDGKYVSLKEKGIL